MADITACHSHESDLWGTPLVLYNQLDKKYHFTLDPCCFPGTAKCPRFFTPRENGLLQSWAGEMVFMNPPYSDASRWMWKAFTEWRDNHTRTVALLPARPGNDWFHHIATKVGACYFVRGRLIFQGASNAAPFDSMIIDFVPGWEGPSTMESYIPPAMVVAGQTQPQAGARNTPSLPFA